MHRPTNRLRPVLLAAAAAALVFATTALAGSGVGSTFNLGQTNTVDAQSILSGNPAADPLLKVISAGTGATVRAQAGTGIAVNGISTSGTGQYGQSTSGIGLQGAHTGSTGTASGVFGSTASTDAGSAGVTGKNTGGGPALAAIVNTGVAPLKVNSSTKVASLNSDLLDGIDSSAFQLAGTPFSVTTTGTGLSATNIYTNSAAPAIYAETDSHADNAYGVFGAVNTGGAGLQSAGVKGLTADVTGNGYGVWGEAPAGGEAGVYGSTANGIGVKGEATGSGKAAEFDGAVDVKGRIAMGQSLAISGATPNVSGGNVFTTNNSTSTAITDLTGGSNGQIVTIEALDTNTTMTDGTHLFLNDNWTPGYGDVIQLVTADGTNWAEISRSDN